MNAKKSITKKSRILNNSIFRAQCILCSALLVFLTIISMFFPAQLATYENFIISTIEKNDEKSPLARFSQQAIAMFFIDASAKSKDINLPDFDVAPYGNSFDMFETKLITVSPVKNYYISSDYGWRTDPFTDEWSFHNGVDLAAPLGEAVYAVMDGVVEKNVYSTSYGNYLQLRHEDGSVTLYAHLQYAFVREGEIVAVGTQIGTVGSTGRSTGAHLHFESISENINLNPASLVN